jgi:hypothetical protein
MKTIFSTHGECKEMKATWIPIAILTLLAGLTIAPVTSADDEAPGQGGRRQPPSFADFDTNGDGCLTEDEFEAMRAQMRERVRDAMKHRRERQGSGGGVETQE